MDDPQPKALSRNSGSSGYSRKNEVLLFPRASNGPELRTVPLLDRPASYKSQLADEEAFVQQYQVSSADSAPRELQVAQECQAPPNTARPRQHWQPTGLTDSGAHRLQAAHECQAPPNTARPEQCWQPVGLADFSAPRLQAAQECQAPPNTARPQQFWQTGQAGKLLNPVPKAIIRPAPTTGWDVFEEWAADDGFDEDLQNKVFLQDCSASLAELPSECAAAPDAPWSISKTLSDDMMEPDAWESSWNSEDPPLLPPTGLKTGAGKASSATRKSSMVSEALSLSPLLEEPP